MMTDLRYSPYYECPAQPDLPDSVARFCSGNPDALECKEYIAETAVVNIITPKFTGITRTPGCTLTDIEVTEKVKLYICEDDSSIGL